MDTLDPNSVPVEQFNEPSVEDAKQSVSNESTQVVPEQTLSNHEVNLQHQAEELSHADFERVEFEEEQHVYLEDEDEEPDEDAELHDEVKLVTSTDYSSFSKEALVSALNDLVATRPIEEIRGDVESIKIFFYKAHKSDIDRKRKLFLDAGGDILDFKLEEEPLESRLKDLLKRYKERKSEYNQKLEAEKEVNLKEKLKIIEDIKELSNRQESINQTFHEFRELQKHWRNIGPVPQQSIKDLWENYHHHVEKFYDFIKINKELRDLDLKRNLEAKLSLCEKTEDLLNETSVVSAFRQLQNFHNQWREIGPVTPEMRDTIWERFKEATSKINKKHQDHFEFLKDSQKKNLELKSVLCEKAEEFGTIEIASFKAWDDKSKEMLELQKVWKTIGFAPKKDNNRVFLRFRAACDAFYARKRDFYMQHKEVQNNNLQLKTDLCIQAEALRNSNEWKKTTEDLINLQKRWKEIGPVPRKHSDHVWKRFRAACDEFFKRKSEHFSEKDSQFEENLKLKKQLISDIQSFELTTDPDANFAKYKEFQRRWAEIGFVAFKYKDEIQRQYRESIEKLFDNMKMDDSKKRMMKFKNKIDNISTHNKNGNKLRYERDKYFNKLSQLQNDISVWENNIGFFAKSKNAEAMISEVKSKIENAKNEMLVIEEKIKLIDNLDDE